MNIRKNITRWGPTSLAVLLAASLVGPVYAQPSAEQAESTAAITDDATASAEQVAEAQELPRGHFRLPEHGDIIGEYYTVTVEDPKRRLSTSLVAIILATKRFAWRTQTLAYGYRVKAPR